VIVGVIVHGFLHHFRFDYYIINAPDRCAARSLLVFGRESPEEFQAKLESMTADVLPKARKRIEKFVEILNRTSNQAIDLFEKALGVYQATSVPEAQRRLQDLFESSLATLRTSVENALNTNTKIVASWKDCLEVCEITAVAARH
jgi:hypothetical protein